MSSKTFRMSLLSALLLTASCASAQLASWPLSSPAFTAPAAELGGLAQQPGSSVALPIPVGADPVPEAKIHEAVLRQHQRIGTHPQSIAARVELIFLQVEAGAGDQARVTAQRALTMTPSSPAALAAQGWALEHDSIGVRFGAGFRWKDAVASWRKAVEAAPHNAHARLQLAVLEEYDSIGFRYASDARLDDAIAQYRQLRTLNRPLARRYEENLLFDLFYARRYSEVLTEARSAPASPQRTALRIAAEAAGKNSAAGLELARPLSGEARGAAVRTAASLLIALRMYARAADLLADAGAGVGTSQQIDLLRGLPQRAAYADTQRKQAMPLLTTAEPPHSVGGNDPRAVVQDLIVAELTGRLDQDGLIEMVIAHHSYLNLEARRRIVRRNLDAAQTLLRMWKKTGCAFDVLSDMALSNVRLTTSGEDPAGFRVTLEPTERSPAQIFFVIHRQGFYHVVGEGRSSDAEAGSEALWMLQKNSEATTRAILDWKREEARGGSNSALATFWTAGEKAGPDTRRREMLACAALMGNNPALTPLLPTLAALRDKSPASEQPAIDVLLARGYIFAGDKANALATTRRLLAANPDSATIHSLTMQADSISGEIGHWNALLEAQLARRPGDRTLLEQTAKKDEAAGDFLRARADLKSILDGGHAATVDYNLYGWLALFSRPIAEDAIPSSLHANEMSHRMNFSALHTLACLDAVTGRPAEARKVILHAMDVNNLATPNDAVWMVMGYVYEQYGMTQAAIAAYHNVSRPERPVDPAESYVLAQRRLRALEQDGRKVSAGHGTFGSMRGGQG